jgi:hypothetical protein
MVIRESIPLGLMLLVMNRATKASAICCHDLTVLRPNWLNHRNATFPRLNGNSLHINKSLYRHNVILCWSWLMWATGFVRPSYASNRGAVNLFGSSAHSISSEKGDDETKSKAFQTLPCSPFRADYLIATSWCQGLLSRCRPRLLVLQSFTRSSEAR